MPTVSPLDELAGRVETYVAELHRRFFRALSREDCADVVQDVFLAAAQSATCQSLNRYQLEAWVRRAAQHRALDVVKDTHHRGQGVEARAPRLDITEFAEVLAADTPEDADDPHRDALLAAFRRLPARQQQILGLRHLDNLTREACARVLNMSVMTFRRSHADAVRRLIDLVIQTQPHDTCAEARALISLSVDRQLEREAAARLDAHLAGCAHCHHYRRRSCGLLAFSPLPAVTFVDRIAARLHGVLDRLTPAAQATDGSLAATGGGGLAAGGAKVVAVLAAGAAVAAGPTVVHHVTHGALGHADRPTSAQRNRSVAPQVTASYARRAAPSASAPTSSTATTTTSARSARAPRPSSPGAGELKPPGHEVTNATTTAPAPVVPARAAMTHHSITTKAAPVTASAATTPDSSHGEFAPHP